MKKSCVAACLESVRMAVESVSGCAWNECPDQRGITVRMCVEWVSESAWNPHLRFKLNEEGVIGRWATGNGVVAWPESGKINRMHGDSRDR